MVKSLQIRGFADSELPQFVVSMILNNMLTGCFDFEPFFCTEFPRFQLSTPFLLH
jgi:hypothetical protein